ncbi:MAG TPA: VOC family protein [Myxococcales bacterium]|nr:VOC family protein [Myxococcales bacterium]
MIQRVSHMVVYVLSQDGAYDFYVNKLGFEVRTDAKMGDFRWLTVGPKGQPDLEVALMEVKPGPMLDEARCKLLRELIQKGTFGFGAFDTADVRKTYQELKARGVQFISEPKERPYGIETILKDDSGNWFSLTQHR